VRTHVGGKLKPDAIADNRLSQTPVPRAILILLNREHNYICDELATRYPGKFTTDEELFQQARIILVGVYINTVVRIYGEAVFNEGKANGDAVLDIRHAWRHTGNHLPIEFNLSACALILVACIEYCIVMLYRRVPTFWTYG
jgi:hypothetical protein